MLITILIPIHNEEDVLPLLTDRIQKVKASVAEDFELLFIDDGSTDSSVSLIERLKENNAAIRLIQLTRNFGKEAAVTAGLENARGDAVILMDADLQDPPELIPSMITEWHRGADVVLMKRRTRIGESAMRRFSAAAYYRLLNALSDDNIPLDTGDFRLVNRRTVDAINQLHERNRYLKGIFAWVGMRTVTLTFDRDPRAAGETKWHFFKLLSFAIDGITSFSIKPLRLALTLGLLAASLGAVFGIWELIRTLVFGIKTPGYASMIIITTFLAGVQLLCIGILGEYLGRIYVETKHRPIYLIKSDTNETSTDSKKNLNNE
jgi:glycosyltransferase involved in cell wall biosynthesis